jgi:Carboxypeptidase regulatory-like domain
MKRFLLAVAFVGLVGMAWAQLNPGPEAKLDFLVIKDDNGKPVRNAGVVMHPVNRSGQQSRGGFELKTDSEGKANFDGVPYGQLRVQVLAPGFQTFGEDYDINKPEMEITVKLKRPQKQYSIYGDAPTEKKDDQKKDPEQKPQ